MGDTGLTCVALFLAFFEATCLAPEQIQLVVAFLLAKARGGFRAINLFASLYRLWVRARRGIAKQWEAAHPRPYYAFGSGAGTIKAVWQQAVNAEHAARSSGQVGGIF